MKETEDISTSCKSRGEAERVKVKRNAGIFHRASGMQRNQEASWRGAPSSNHNTELQLTSAFLFCVFTLNSNYEYVSSEGNIHGEETKSSSESLISECFVGEGVLNPPVFT